MSGFPKASQNLQSSDCPESSQLSKVGQYLKAIRTRQGLSLQQVAQRTHIQPKQLRAIEAGNWMQLPEAIYVKGFLKQYAQSLGLDGIAIAERLSVTPAAINPKWLNQANFSAREQGVGPSLTNWWSRLTPLV
ncbi:MAG: helix-turn-helix domain-containing protein [Leptolyngbyaceae cyanobacterium]